MAAPSILDLVGDTPLPLSRYAPEGGAAIYAKLEFLNPRAAPRTARPLFPDGFERYLGKGIFESP